MKSSTTWCPGSQGAPPSRRMRSAEIDITHADGKPRDGTILARQAAQQPTDDAGARCSGQDPAGDDDHRPPQSQPFWEEEDQPLRAAREAEVERDHERREAR